MNLNSMDFCLDCRDGRQEGAGGSEVALTPSYYRERSDVGFGYFLWLRFFIDRGWPGDACAVQAQ